jgi:hypothetical protein
MDMQSQNEVLASTLAALQATYQMARPSNVNQEALLAVVGPDLYAEEGEGDDAKGPWTPEVTKPVAWTVSAALAGSAGSTWFADFCAAFWQLHQHPAFQQF